MTIITGDAGPNFLTGDRVWDAEQQAWVYAETSDEIFGLGGDDSLYGGALSDTLWGGAGDDYMLGEDGGDVLYGEADNDNMGGGAGDDVLYGGAGNDTLGGHQGHDILYGGEGNDYLLGGLGDGAETEGDVFDGGPGDDWMFGNSGAQTMDGGTGTDTAHLFFLGLSAPVEFVALTPGATIVPLVGGAPYGRITGVEIYHNLWGGTGNDRLGASYVLPAGASYLLVGGDGEDTAVVDLSADAGAHSGSSDAGTGWTSIGNSATGGALSIQAEHLHYTGNALNGITSGGGNDRLTGLGGNDTFGGGGGNDVIDGAGGADTLYGGEGDDSLEGGTGDDWLDGQTGTDTAVFPGSFAQYTLSPQADRLRVTGPGDEVDQLFGIERLRFADGTVAVRPDFNIDSTTFTFTAGTVSKAEGSAGTTAFAFTVTRAGATGIPQEIGWTVAGATGPGTLPASAGDFAGGAFPSGKVSFAPGQASATITVTVAGDTGVEANERFAVSLGAPPPSAVVTAGTIQGVILNDDIRLDIAAVNATQKEGTLGASTAYSFTVSAYGLSTVTRTVDWAVTSENVGNTVTASDFVGNALPFGTVTLAPGEMQKTITIAVLGDTNLEPDEVFRISLANPSPTAFLGFNATTALIQNDDSRIDLVSDGGAQKPEGSGGGTTGFTFTLAATGDSSTARVVSYSVSGVGGGPTQPSDGADFAGGALPTGTVTFAPGETQASITLPVAADDTVEPDKGMRLVLGPVSPNTAIGKGALEGVIYNDDTSLALTPLSISQSEGDIGTRTYSYTVERTGLLAGSTTVAWTVTPHPDAPAGADDFAGGVLPAGSLTFAPGQASATITVTTLGDTAIEPSEAFRLTLSNPVGATIVQGKAQGILRPDDARIDIAGLAYNQAEGSPPPLSPGAATAFTFTLTRTGATAEGASVAYAVQGIAGNGTVPANAADFAGGALPAGTVSFAAGETSRVLTISVAADADAEANERFAVTLSAPTGAMLGTATAQGIIRNDDLAPAGATLAIAPLAASKPEGSTGGTTPYTFTVTRGGNTAGTHSVAYAVSGTAGSNTVPANAADFAGATLPSGNIVFAPGETSRILTVAVAADLAGELNERFAVTLSAPSAGATLGTATAQGVILNDDTSLGFTATALSKPEGNAGTTTYSYTVARAGTITGTTKVDWSFSGGGVAGTVAANAADFALGTLPPGGTLTFLAGETSKTIAIAVAGDTAPENGLNESFTLSLGNATPGVAITTPTATGTIRDDDTIYGTSGNNTLVGTAGPDLFVIGEGQDTITGGGGTDSFRFLPSAIGPSDVNAFTFTDFSRAAGEKFDLSRIDAIAGTLANDAFSFIGDAFFSGAAGELRWHQFDATHLVIVGTTDTGFTPDLAIWVTSPGPVDSGWFVL